MCKKRVRIRFSKQGDLRFIGHRDLVRTFERMVRRAGLTLSMSQGFHPKARMSFPSALSIGIEGVQEVMELELFEISSGEAIKQSLQRHAPPGLAISQVQILEPGDSQARIDCVAYEMPVPAQRQKAARLAVRRLLDQSSYCVQRPGRREPIDLCANLEALELNDGVLRIKQRLCATATAKPREILDALDLGDLEQQGIWLKRTVVELAS